MSYITSAPLNKGSDPEWVRSHLAEHHSIGVAARDIDIEELVKLHDRDHNRPDGAWGNHTHRSEDPPREKLYIAGPMRGFPCFNFPAFDEAASTLEAAGIEPISPAQMDRDAFGWGVCPSEDVMAGFSVEDALRRDFQAILGADGIVLLPGWEKSSGATAERFVAETTGKEVYLYNGGKLEVAPPWSANLCAVEKKGDVIPTGDATKIIGERNREAGKAPIAAFGSLLTEQLVDAAEKLAYPPSNLTDGETRVVDPSTGGAKGQKLARFDLLPSDALWAVAEHYGKGAAKYEERNWERGYAWSLSYGALQRHLNQFWSGEDVDAELQGPHLAAAAFHVLALLAFSLRGAGTDDRPKR